MAAFFGDGHHVILLTKPLIPAGRVLDSGGHPRPGRGPRLLVPTRLLLLVHLVVARGLLRTIGVRVAVEQALEPVLADGLVRLLLHILRQRAVHGEAWRHHGTFVRPASRHTSQVLDQVLR